MLVDSYHYKRHQSIDSSQHNGSSGRSYREDTPARKRRHRERQEDDNVYEDEMEYKNNRPETDSDGDRLDRKRRGDRSEKRSMHVRRESKSRDNHRTPTSCGSSSDEDLYTHAYTKRKSRHRKNISEPSSNDAKTKPSEDDLLRHKQQNTKSTRQRSRHSERDEDDRQESKKVEGRSRHRSSRSMSHDGADKNDTSDRWQPDSEHDDHISEIDAKDYDDRKPKDRRNDHETRSGSVVEDTSKEIRRSRDRDDRTREKRKRI